MATTHGPDSRDKFDMTQSTETWNNFLSLAKWTVIGSLIVVVGMAIFLTGGQPTH
jgi:Bacterial aa3 type cytochrome c oxidase subunit IV